MKKIRVGVKYCGQCTPHIDGPSIIERVKDIDDRIVFVPWGASDKEVLLVISGCPTDCASRPAFDGPMLNVAGNFLERKRLPASRLPEAILKRIFGQFSKPRPDCNLGKETMEAPSNLKGKVALVTGSTKGIGRGIVGSLASAGADVVVVSRNQEDCNRVADEIKRHGNDALPVAADLTDLDAIEKLVEKTVRHYGRIDILVNNAGASLTKRAEEITEADWDRILNIDLKSVFFCAQIAGRQMIAQKSGKIINVASILGLVGDRQVLPYCVAKGGVIQMTKALALEWAKYNIQVNTICPGYVITPMNEADLKDEKIFNHIIRKIPMRRLGDVDDMVGAVNFLASQATNYMTGQSLVIDGGWTAE